MNENKTYQNLPPKEGLKSQSYLESSSLSLPKTKNKAKFDYLIYIGRFQPFHNGHAKLVDIAMSLSKHVIILIGSCGCARDTRNPFTFRERKDMIENTLCPLINDDSYSEFKSRVTIEPLLDHPYNNNKWIQQVQNTVDLTVDLTTPDEKNLKIGLIGNHKDNGAWYLDIFPRWKDFLEVESYHNPNKIGKQVLSATEIREKFFEGYTEEYIKHIPQSVRKVMDCFREFERKSYSKLVDEFNFLKKYKKQWKGLAHPVQFITVDAIVTQGGHILLVKRGANPGKGLWALPGGFKNADETSKQAIIRELKEETNIGLPQELLESLVMNQHPIVFDDPKRSLRGTTVTHVFYLKTRLDKKHKLATLKAGDDARKASWFTYKEVAKMRDQLFEDHYHLIDYCINLHEKS